MFRLSYPEMINTVKNKNGLVPVLNILDKAITYITVVLYLLFLFYSLMQIKNDGGTLLYRSVLVPAVSFAMVSIFRKKFDMPRPYEVYGFEPLIKKDTIHKSFPSRHVFSIFMIACTFAQVNIALAIVTAILGLALAAIRVMTGVHFVKDVVAGFAIALLISFLTYGIFGGVLGQLMLPFR